MDKSLTSNVKSARKCENINDPLDTYCVDYVAMMFSKAFIKMHVIPNVITVLSGIVGVAGGILLAFNSLLLNIIGVLLIILAAVFDASDGQVARLTKKYSNLGRTLDGFMDFLVYLSIYVALCFRLFPVNIPFTETAWGFWIIPVAAVAFYIFGGQSRTVDYFKNMHMYMIKKGNGSELSRTGEIKKQIAACKKFSFERLRLSIYCSYTKTQEKEAPETQKLLNLIEENGKTVPPSLSEAYTAKSSKYVKFTNLLTFNLRTIVLFILLFLPNHLEILYFPFVVFVLEPIRIVLICKFEKLADNMVKQNYFSNTETDK